jgi:DNA-binding MarR family transcriptional regulator
MSMPQLACASATLRRASRSVSRFYDEQMQASGMRVTQFTLLQVLEKAAPITQGRLGEILALDSTTLTRSLKLVEKEGWVTSAPGDDRRERHFTLTAKGKKQIQIAKEHWHRAQAKLRKHLGAGEWEQFMTLADRITGAAIASRDAS